METETYKFNILTHLYQEETSFDLVKTTDNESLTEFSIKNTKGVGILDEDYDSVLECAVSLFDSISQSSTFDSVRGDEFIVEKESTAQISHPEIKGLNNV